MIVVERREAGEEGKRQREGGRERLAPYSYSFTNLLLITYYMTHII